MEEFWKKTEQDFINPKDAERAAPLVDDADSRIAANAMSGPAQGSGYAVPAERANAALATTPLHRASRVGMVLGLAVVAVVACGFIYLIMKARQEVEQARLEVAKLTMQRADVDSVGMSRYGVTDEMVANAIKEQNDDATFLAIIVIVSSAILIILITGIILLNSVTIRTQGLMTIADTFQFKQAPSLPVSAQPWSRDIMESLNRSGRDRLTAPNYDNDRDRYRRRQSYDRAGLTSSSNSSHPDNSDSNAIFQAVDRDTMPADDAAGGLMLNPHSPPVPQSASPTATSSGALDHARIVGMGPGGPDQRITQAMDRLT